MRRSNGARIESYRDLDAWQLAMEIVVSIYRITRAFPSEEKFGLSRSFGERRYRFDRISLKAILDSEQPSFDVSSRSRAVL